MARYEPAPVAISSFSAEPEEDLDTIPMEDMEEPSDLDLPADEMDDIKDDKDL